MAGRSGSRTSWVLILLGLISSFVIGMVVLADDHQDEMKRCRDLKKHGQLLAQQLEASKQCHKNKYEKSVTVTCLYSFDGTVIEVEGDDPEGARKVAGNVRYTLKSLGPDITLSFGQGDRTGGYPMLKRVGRGGSTCGYDWAWLRPDEVIIASMVTETM